MKKLSPIKLTKAEYSLNLFKMDMKNLHIVPENNLTEKNAEAQTMEYNTCKICYSIVKDPICCNQCEDLFCSSCLNDWINDGKGCPHCRAKPFKESRINRFVKNMLNNIVIVCPSGCEEKFIYENLIKHLETCKKTEKISLCKLCNHEIKLEFKDEIPKNKDKSTEDNIEIEKEYQQLNNDVTFEKELNTSNDLYETYCKEIEKHSEICPEILFECCYCNEKIKNFNVHNHIEICFTKSIIKCEVCRVHYPEKHKSAHNEFFCKKVIEMNNLCRNILDK